MLDKLNPRERIFVAIGAVIVVVLLLGLIGREVFGKRARLADGVEQTRIDLVTLQRLRQRMATLPRGEAEIDLNQFRAQVFSMLEERQLKGDVRHRSEERSRDEERLVIEIHLRGVPLDPIFSLLYSVEVQRRPPASVERFQFVQPIPGRELYDVQITLTITRSKG